ncbi:SRPBCC family protein [Roseisolibacter sp. H3M3-2]|uniref:SRPBCC family protein n=1 Tax=Roseisolibacter sp. H3M3-2 TaxID=3031323 RepID=UPI0023DB2A0C|nr:SRPBCC family protein [Roseisolibacter sp. H3M3-2]MDF1505248.1 SRPBCC family protein [Roseisolibacter sp. H3M3-2]
MTAPRTVTMVRTLAAPAARVYAALTAGALLARWMTAPPYRVAEAFTEPRVGGAYRVRVVGPDGDEHLTTGTFLELVPNARVVQSWRYEGSFGRDDTPTEVTFTLRALGPALTELTLVHARILPGLAHYDHVEAGWEECLAALETLLDDDVVLVRVERRVAASPARAFDAWTDAAVLGRWMGGTGELLEATADARPGGSLRLVVRRDGDVVAHEGEYVEFDRPRRLAFTWAIPAFSEDRDLVRVTFAPDGDGCAMTLVHRMGKQWAEYAERSGAAWGELADVVAASLTPS